MARPVVSQAAENLYEILSPLAYADESLDWPLLKYCEALAMNLQLVLDYGGDWSQIIDIDRVPYEAIPWLGQLVGVTTPPRIEGETETAHEDRIREYVRGVPGFARGTPAAIIQAAQQYLTGTKTVMLRERQGGAYQLQVLTWVNETDPEDLGTTNICTNGGAESNTTGWNASIGTIERVSDSPVFGSWGFKVTAASNSISVNSTGTISAPTAGRLFWVSAYLRGISGSIGKWARIDIYEVGGAQADSLISSSTLILTGTSVRFVCGGSLVQNDRTGVRIRVLSNNGGPDWVTGDVLYFDGAQIEENIVVTPYVETDGSPASRQPGQGPILDALLSQKPAGIILDYDVLAGQDFQLVYTNHPDFQDVYNDYSTWQGMFAATPGI